MDGNNKEILLFSQSQHSQLSQSSHLIDNDNVNDQSDAHSAAEIQDGQRLPHTTHSIPEVVASGDPMITTPSLTAMPTAIVGRILQYIHTSSTSGMGKRDQDGLRALRALERTCRSFRDILGLNETWETLSQDLERDVDAITTTCREKLFVLSGTVQIRREQKSAENIILKFMDGASGVHRVIELILERMNPTLDFETSPFTLEVRGDSMMYLTEVIQSHMIDRLINAQSAAMHRTRGTYPEICVDDYCLMDAMLGGNLGGVYCRLASKSHTCKRWSSDPANPSFYWTWPADDCCSHDIVGYEQRYHIARALSYRAGVLKLNERVFGLIVHEIFHYMALIVIDAYESCKGMVAVEMEDSSIGLSSSSSWTPTEEEESVKDFSEYCPPVQQDQNGKIRCIIVPRQIEDAAKRIGMQSLLGFGDFGSQWAPSAGKTVEEELEEAVALYDDMQGESDCDESSHKSENEANQDSDNSSLLSLGSFLDSNEVMEEEEGIDSAWIYSGRD